MLYLLAALLWCLVAAFLVGRAAVQFRAYCKIPAVSNVDARTSSRLTVVVPARNEAANIAGCLQGLLKQSYSPSHFSIVVVDDDSTDDTAGIVRAITRSDPRIRLLQSGALPGGWTGKSHACWQGARQADGRWLCFIDADTVALPHLLSSAVCYAESSGIDLLCLQPFQELLTFWERLIIPAGLFLVAFAADIRCINDAAKPDAAANGQFILIRRCVYEAVGGHAAVRSYIDEDTALARRTKRAGCRIYMADGSSLIRVRMYTSLGQLWEGLSKNAVNVAKSVPAAICLSIGALLVGWLSLLLPAAVLTACAERLMAGDPIAFVSLGFVLLGSTVLFSVHVAESRYLHIPLWYGTLFPLGVTLIAAIVGASIWRRWTGKIAWKSRIYRTGR